MTYTHESRRPIKGIDQQKDFALAGRAFFTVLNTSTGNRITFRVIQEASGTYEVSAFTGSENSNPRHYSRLGKIREDGTYCYDSLNYAIEAAAEKAHDMWLLRFVKNLQQYIGRGWELSERQMVALEKNLRKHDTRAGKVILRGDMKSKAFAWFWDHIVRGINLPDVVEFWHEGRCCACGRRLTVPESIETGKGPVCSMKVA